MNGFAWSFYGFFVAALLWVGGYFVWAVRASAHDQPEPGGGRDDQRDRGGAGR